MSPDRGNSIQQPDTLKARGCVKGCCDVTISISASVLFMLVGASLFLPWCEFCVVEERGSAVNKGFIESSRLRRHAVQKQETVSIAYSPRGINDEYIQKKENLDHFIPSHGKEQGPPVDPAEYDCVGQSYDVYPYMYKLGIPLNEAIRFYVLLPFVNGRGMQPSLFVPAIACLCILAGLVTNLRVLTISCSNTESVKSATFTMFLLFTAVIIWVCYIILAPPWTLHEFSANITITEGNKTVSQWTMDFPAARGFYVYAVGVVISVVICFASVIKKSYTEVLLDHSSQPPQYWKVQHRATKRYDITARAGHKLEALLNLTAKPETHGQGRDSHGSVFEKFKVKKVERIENLKLWKRYAVHRGETISDGPAIKPPVQTASLNSALQMLETSNEFMLFHGTKKKYVDNVCNHGFDNRVSSTGLFGNGIYFAESASKSDQYVPRGEGSMFLARVTLGTPHLERAARNKTRRPPCIEGHYDPLPPFNGTPCSHPRCDSVIALSKLQDPNACLPTFREFIVYDGAQCYPEFLITYERVR
eukprot:m.93604 g.93604  ORF g.93604 m.93604 type:complete len:533 (-) comp13403_c0_seq2:2791-4389(-)